MTYLHTEVKTYPEFSAERGVYDHSPGLLSTQPSSLPSSVPSISPAAAAAAVRSAGGIADNTGDIEPR